MKKLMILMAIVGAGLLLTGYSSLYAHDTGHGHGQGWHGGGMGQHGRGMMGQHGGGMGWQGGHRGNMGCPNCPYANNYSAPNMNNNAAGQPMSLEQARSMVENYVARNPNLNVGSVEEKDGAYQAEIVTKDGSMVDRMVIDKSTGRMHSVY
jgi:hypothetical protein